VFPRPFIFEGHELIDVDLVAIDQPLLIDIDAFVDAILAPSLSFDFIKT
jgi:hypothetical protein